MGERVDDGAHLVRAAVVDVGDAFRESNVEGEEDEEGGDGLEGEVHGGLLYLMGGVEGRETRCGNEEGESGG